MVAMLLLLLLGIMGIALDFGRLFIVKTELQTAVDSCALAAAQELDGQGTALARARSAGLTAANMNKVNLQSANWDGQGLLSNADITFKDAAYIDTTAATAKYAVCSHSQASVKMWLLHMLGADSGNTAQYPSTRSVLASAVATRASAQSTCPVPLALKAKTGSVAPNYGFQIGEWITVFNKSDASAGEMGWYNLDSSPSASETAAELSERGYCGTKVGSQLYTPGVKGSVNDEWNRRFGIYKNNDGPDVSHPDQTGYAYSARNWPNAPPQNAFSGIVSSGGSDPSAKNYVTQRIANEPFGTTLQIGSDIVFGNVKPAPLNSFKNSATRPDHGSYGTGRRVVIVPVIDDTRRVTDFVCVLMLAPITDSNSLLQVEFLGNASNTASPCTSKGFAGGTAGPLVPVLVR